MWEGSAHAARRDIAALASAGLGVAELHAAAIDIVDRVVPTELTCWASMDPDTTVISSMTSGSVRIPQEYEPVLATSEYSGTEPHTFADLAQRSNPVARLSDLPMNARGLRFNEVWRPLGLSHEVRAVFRVDGACWGAAGLVRQGDFTDREVEFLAAIAPTLATATRVAARCAPEPATLDPAIVIVGEDLTPRATTAAAAAWQAELDEIAPGRFLVMLRVVAVGAQSTGTFRARIRDANEGWILLQASKLISDTTTETVVTIERASGADLMPLLFAAYGLTPREREICHELITGGTTTEIAARLTITPRTLQDHLKSIFTKLNVHSRAALTAKLRP
ncbi:helix-turn-helix transcriptional regulator [Actinocrispum sp. NPDC049592]|uniref:helix-turn-helix transcriptional regulator n=1 Tax=Actinocrispum sp. NPDC049592 TaxID=3154835 RepID=UPI003427EA02